LLTQNNPGTGLGSFQILSAKPQSASVKASWQPSSGTTGYFVRITDSTQYVVIAYAAASGTSVGITEPERVEQTLQLAEWPIPEKLWDELEPLIVAGEAGVL
jgi:hypothetical protein